MSSTSPLADGLLAHASGALWIPSSKTLFVADLHLGYSWAQRRRGELGPIADAQTVQKLMSVCSELQPERIVFLGDVVHAPRPCDDERRYIEQTFSCLCATAGLISVQGNHDRAFAAEFAHVPIQIVREWTDERVLAVHGDKLPESAPEDKILLLGHLHPSMPVKDVSGAGRRLPVFLSTRTALVLPAFSPFARGYNLLDGLPNEFASLMGAGPVLAHIASGTRVVSVGPVQAAIERMYQADVSAPAVFRRFRR